MIEIIFLDRKKGMDRINKLRINYENTVTVQGVNIHDIENFEIENTCTNVERMPPNEDLEENVIIHSSIKIFVTENAEKKEQIVVAKTTLADEETREILETTFEPELI